MAITDSRQVIIKKRGYPNKIAGDQYSLYLSNYPIAAHYLSKRIQGEASTIAELCCGIGVTLIALAKTFDHLVGIEIDKNILKSCEQNLKFAGLLDKVTLIVGDVTNESVLKQVKADIVIYDIPYWVPKILNDGSNILNKNPNFEKLLNKIKKLITENLVIFAPPQFDYEFAKRTLGKLEFQRIIINGRYDRNYIFTGNLILKEGITEKQLTYQV